MDNRRQTSTSTDMPTYQHIGNTACFSAPVLAHRRGRHEVHRQRQPFLARLRQEFLCAKERANERARTGCGTYMRVSCLGRLAMLLLPSVMSSCPVSHAACPARPGACREPPLRTRAAAQPPKPYHPAATLRHLAAAKFIRHVTPGSARLQRSCSAAGEHGSLRMLCRRARRRAALEGRGEAEGGRRRTRGGEASRRVCATFFASLAALGLRHVMIMYGRCLLTWRVSSLLASSPLKCVSTSHGCAGCRHGHHNSRLQAAPQHISTNAPPTQAHHQRKHMRARPTANKTPSHVRATSLIRSHMSQHTHPGTPSG